MKNTKIIVFIIFVLVVILAIFYFILTRPKNNNEPISLQAQSVLSSQTDSQGSVTIKVTPKNLTEFSSSWDFEIVLDTHSGNLDQDLTKISVLVDDKGNQFKSIAWEGDPPQGHHRQGLIKFKPISPKPSSIELKIYKIGNIDEKSFKWELK